MTTNSENHARIAAIVGCDEFVEGQVGWAIGHARGLARNIPKRGTLYGCGMATIPLGDGVIDSEEIVKPLRQQNIDGPTTLKTAGEEAARTSVERLREWTKS